MEFESITLEKSKHVATIKMNKPNYYNVMDFTLVNDMVKAVEMCTVDQETRAVLITGVGKVFSGGGDVNAFIASTNISELTRQILKQTNMLIMGIRRMPKPVIAAINGVCGGSGISLAAACDLRICASSVKFRLGFTSVGLSPDGGCTLTLPLLIGFSKTLELAFLDKSFDAQQALEFGLVNKVVDPAELERESNELAIKIAAGPTVAFAGLKENINNAMFCSLERQLEYERAAMIKAACTLDAREGLTAFAEKRKPKFTGK